MLVSAAFAAALLLQATAPDLAPEPAPAAAAPTVASLQGAQTAQVRARLGEPAVAHAEGAGAMWTYRLPRCALFVYFADAGQGLRMSGASTGPRRYGETAPDADACLSDARATAPASPSPQAP